jgi:hypothetical protein
MCTGLLEVGAVSTEKRAVSSEASGMVWNMRNNQSFETCCGGVLIEGPAHTGFALSEEWTRM